MNELEDLMQDARRTAGVVAALALLMALDLRHASRAATRQLAHTSRLEQAALSCAACQPTSGGAA